ncbi:hypothetical protein DQ392_16115 [Streptomyces reniochalinae]|uniref:Uncharacterized protein n=1 Tax=Streptomyces reniochalinae TaxID=2250578 RepID=A0A367EKD2_9ACTN|nr:hypothetical protein DQ392_16115 [Streptomyces reniochalinae]
MAATVACVLERAGERLGTEVLPRVRFPAAGAGVGQDGRVQDGRVMAPVELVESRLPGERIARAELLRERRVTALRGPARGVEERAVRGAETMPFRVGRVGRPVRVVRLGWFVLVADEPGRRGRRRNGRSGLRGPLPPR